MAKKLTSYQSKPAVKKVKKFSLAGYNLSGVSQAPQASYYLGKAAAEEAGQNQNAALEALKESQASIKDYTEQQKSQKESAVAQSGAQLTELAFSTGKDIVKNRAAKKVAEEAAKKAGTTVAANAASAAAPSAFMSGVSSYGQPVAAAVAIGGSLIKNTGGDNDPTTFTQAESNRYGLGNIMEKTGQFAGYGSMLGPYGTLAGAVAGLGYGIYDTVQDNKKSRTDANKLAGSTAAPMAAANNAFINSKMMDAYAGGNQMAKYGGMRYDMGGMDFYNGDPLKKKKPGEAEAPAPSMTPPPAIDWSKPGATLSLNGVPAPMTAPSAGSTRQYQAGNRVLNVTTEDPTLQEGYEAPVGNAMTNTDQASLGEVGKFVGNAVRGNRKYDLNTVYEQFRADNPGKVTSEQINQFIKDNGLKFQDFQSLDKDWRSSQWKEAGYGKDGTGGNSPFGNPVIEKGTMGGKKDCYGGNCSPGGANPTWTRRNGGYEFGGSYNDLGGTRYVEGGKIKPIPNSNDVEYLGDTHEEGGIKLDSRTEVEDHETGTKINGTQYFFSRVLKTAKGEPYSQAHKAIASSPSLDPISKKNLIKDLAREQEVAAGRDPKQIARTGGMQMYVDGGKKKEPVKKKKGQLGYNPQSQFTNIEIPEEIANPQMTTAKYGIPIMDFKLGMEYVIDPTSGKRVYLDPSRPETYNQMIGITPPKKLSEKEQFAKDLAEREKAVLNQKDLDNAGGANPYNLNPKYNEPPLDPKKLDLSKTWLESHPAFIGGLAQLAGPAYAMLKPYKKSAAMTTAQGAAAPRLARVDKSGEMEDARRQQNAMNTYLKNNNLGPGKIIAMQNVATRTSDELLKISDAQDRENRGIKNAEAQIAAEVAGRNQAAELEASKSNMLADIQQNQYKDERNLAVAEGFGKGLATISKDQRMLDMQYDIARGTDPTGSFNRYEIMEKLRELSRDPNSPVYKKSEQELQKIASDLGYNVVKVVADDKKEDKKFGGFKGVTGKKYTSRLGQLATAKNTAVKKSI
jgi:hypothetical protein